MYVLVKNKEMADIILSEWLGRYPVFHANKKGRHCRRVVDKQHDLLEMVKYGSKIFTEPDLKSWPNKSRHYVYASALDNILSAMEGRRIFDRFGFNLTKSAYSDKGRIPKILIDYELWTFQPACADWVNLETGELLTGYQISRELKDILNHRIDTTLD